MKRGLRFRITVDIERRPSLEPGEPHREVDMGSVVEHGDDLPVAGWRIGFQGSEEVES